MTDNEPPDPGGEHSSEPGAGPEPGTGSTVGPAGADGAEAPGKIGHLRAEVGELQRENAALKRIRRRGRAHTFSSWVLLVLAFLLAIVSILVVFVRNEVLNTDTYVGTVAPLASNPAIQTAIADQVSQQLLAQGDVTDKVRRALPPRASFRATPIADGLGTVVTTATLKFVQSKAFEKLWVQMNRRAHGQIVTLLTGGSKGSLSTSNGTVTLDTSMVADQVIKQLDANGITVFNSVSTSKLPKFTLIRSTQLVRAQRVTRDLNKLALLLPLLTVVCLAGAVLLARNRRRGLEYAAGTLAVAMALLLVALSIGRTGYLNALGGSFPTDALGAAYDTLTAHLREVLRIILVLSLIALIAAILVGNSHVRAWLRDVHVPEWLSGGRVSTFIGVHHKGVRWGLVGGGLALLVLWDSPTPLVVFVVALIVLALVASVSLFRSRRPSPRAVAGGPSSPPPVNAAT